MYLKTKNGSSLEIFEWPEAVLVTFTFQNKHRGLHSSETEIYESVNQIEYPDDWISMEAEKCSGRFFFWFCLPGCLPESEINGPYESIEDIYQDLYDVFNEEVVLND